MKTYRTPRELQAGIERALARRPAPNAACLEQVAELLSAGRHYDWIGIYLAAGPAPQPVAHTEPAPPHTVIPIALGQHVFGALEVRGENGKAVAAADRVLLKQVAAQLARFLHGPGAFLLRKARAAAAQQPSSPQARGHQPASEKAQERSLAAAGVGRR